jgi:hypothetical protein
VRIADGYLWKEWHEHRHGLGALALVLLAATAGIATWLPAVAARNPVTGQAIVALTLLSVVLAVGSELLVRERNAGTLRFLERLPGGLSRAFRAKLAFYALVVLAAIAYGTLLAAGLALARGGPLPLALHEGIASRTIVIGLALSVWVLAISAWMPSGALALPVTTLFLAALGWPALRALGGDPLYRPTAIEGAVFCALCLLGAPISAWASFVPGSRWNRSRVRSATISVAVAALFFLPAWVWAGARELAVANRGFEIFSGWISPDGGCVLLDLERAPTSEGGTRAFDEHNLTAAAVDLASGRARLLGPADERGIVPDVGYSRRAAVLGLEGCPRFAVHGFDTPAALAVLDPRARPWPGEPAPIAFQGLEPRDFGLPHLLAPFDVRWAGAAHVIGFRDEDLHWREIAREPSTGRIFDLDLLLGAPPERQGCRFRHEVLVRAGLWLVCPDRALDPDPRARRERHWIGFDPEARRFEPLAGVEAGDELGPLLDDGRVIWRRADGLFVLDPDRLAREPLSITGARGRVCIRSLEGHNGPPLPSVGPIAVALGTEGASRGALGLLDIGERSLRVVLPYGDRAPQALSVRGPVLVTIEDGRRVVRRDLARGEARTLFSVDSLE